jgi:hypothetical protein
MRFIFCLVVAFVSFSGCKKKVESIKEDLLLKLIVEGQWFVKKYDKGSTDITAAFSPYSFQFKKDFTVDAINFGTVENTGTWNGSIDTKTITSNFQNPSPTLALLNGTWLVTDSGLDYVKATQSINGQACLLLLQKK